MDEAKQFERLAEIAALPVDAPERREWEEDPHRRALLQSYIDFMDAEPAPGSRPDEAGEALEAFLYDKIERRPRRLFVPPAPVLALAAVLLVAVGITTWWPSESERMQRGPAELTLATKLPITSEVDVQFEWDSHEGADDYLLTVYREDLSEVLARKTGGATTTNLALSELPSDLRAAKLAWRVSALESGDVVAQSALETLRIP